MPRDRSWIQEVEPGEDEPGKPVQDLGGPRVASIHISFANDRDMRKQLELTIDIEGTGSDGTTPSRFGPVTKNGESVKLGD